MSDREFEAVRERLAEYGRLMRLELEVAGTDPDVRERSWRSLQALFLESSELSFAALRNLAGLERWRGLSDL